jgi:hypothetical protein
MACLLKKEFVLIHHSGLSENLLCQRLITAAYIPEQIVNHIDKNGGLSSN